jgi:hypothetical protein
METERPRPAAPPLFLPLASLDSHTGTSPKSGPSRVDTVMIQDADHMYHGEKAQVAQTIAKWADTLVLPEAGKGDAQDRH